jgi:uncharacterized protein
MSALLTTVTKGPTSITGVLYTPDDTESKRPAIIAVQPGGDAIGQTASLYASRLAREGFVTICFDLFFLNSSDGQENAFDDPSSRVSDIWATLDHLQNEQTHVVDPDRIG